MRGLHHLKRISISRSLFSFSNATSPGALTTSRSLYSLSRHVRHGISGEQYVAGCYRETPPLDSPWSVQRRGVKVNAIQTGKIALGHVDERALGLHLLRFAETVEEACSNLLPSVLCEYLYSLSEHYTRFYSNCQVNGSPEETSRLLLCEATATVMRKCFHLLGITPVYKI